MHDWQHIFEQASWGLLVVSKVGDRISEANPVCAHMHGYGKAEMVGMSILDLTAQECLAEARGHIVLSEMRNSYRFDSVHVHHDGHYFPVNIDIINIRAIADEPEYRIVNIRDVTEQKELETTLKRAREQLRSLSAYQEHLLEEERKHIAREVHDELGQKLVAMQMGLSNLRLRYADDSALLGRVGELSVLLEETIGVVRDVASNLRPAALTLGLIQAIDWLAEDFSRRSGIACKFETNGVAVAFDEVDATTVFRVVQESLTNVIRHAAASKVDIVMKRERRQLHLLVHDNGKGFNPVAVREKEAFGLMGMRERLLALGGKLHIASAPGDGTTIMIDLPLPAPNKP